MDKRSLTKKRLQRRSLNIGLIVFAVFFIYVAYNMVASMFRPRIQSYEVGEISSAVKDTTYSGLILRSENPFVTDKTGFVHYYVRENSRASVGNTIYSIDEKGEYTKLLTVGDGAESTLTENQLETLKTMLSVYSARYSAETFNSVYDMKFTLQNELLNYLGGDSITALSQLGIDTSYLTTVPAITSGVVEYYYDSMETLREVDLKHESFDVSSYKSTRIAPGTELRQGDFVYKSIDSETWSVYLPLIEADIDELKDVKKVTLRFNDVHLEAQADFSQVTLVDGTIVGKCTLDKYMMQLADRRFTSVTILKSKMKDSTVLGLKIPKTAIVSKSVYTIPEDFATQGGNDNATGFLKEVYTARGTKAEFITPVIYAHRDGYYYVEMEGLEKGTKLLQPEASTVEVSSTKLPTISADEVKTTTEAATQKVKKDKTPVETMAGGFVVEDTIPEAQPNEIPETEPMFAPEEAESADIEEEASEESGEDMTSDEYAEEYATAVEETEPETSAGFLEAAIPGTGGRYLISNTVELKGVFNINRGYCVFTQVNVLDETDDYYIVQADDRRSVSVYDHILLNAASSKEGDIIYK